MFHKIFFTIVLYFHFLPTQIYASEAPPRVPERAWVDITGTQIHLRFEWVGAKPVFSKASAVEFEVIILTDTPKCFAQPGGGGRDGNIRFARNNFPASNDLPWGYTDVWNYWAPPKEERVAEMEKHCGEISDHCKDGLNWSSVVDKDANFAVGTRNPHNFEANTEYWFRYPLEQRFFNPECLTRENGLAWVQINMAVFPDKCTLCSEEKQTCPHLIGLQVEIKVDLYVAEPEIWTEQCPEIDTDPVYRVPLIKRLCVNRKNVADGLYPFAPNAYMSGGGECFDKDGDGYFALNYTADDIPRAMYGHRVGDCNDDPGDPMAEHIQNQNYMPELMICRYENCENGLDDDDDGDVDCYDSDCFESSECNCISGDPCCSVVSGNKYYCGQDDEMYNGNFDELYLCVDGVSTVPPAGYPGIGMCYYGCSVNNLGSDAYCLEETCTPICNPGNSQCSGNNVEVCASDYCSFVYDHTCDIDENCINGICILQNNPDPAPVISHVICGSYQRGDTTTCTIYGSNFVAGGSTFIADMENRQILSFSSIQIQVRGTWACVNDLGAKQVSHLNPDGQRDDKYNLITIVMGELQITAEWPGDLHEGDSGFQVGFNGCNFGQNSVVYVEGVQLTNIHLQAPDQVLATGAVVAESDGTSGDKCVAKYSGATSSFDKKCCYDCITILP
jgi:hypothetical protein